jgi:membrane protease YdiL (CAAX protease family)
VLGGLAFCVHQKVFTLAALGLRWPRGRFLAAGACVGLAAWYLNLLIVTFIQPPGDLKPLERVVEEAALGPTIVAIAVFPAVTEELVFRGVLARALAARYGLVLAVIVSAVFFGIYHVLPPQALATFLLGLALAFIAIRANSVIPTMLAHVLNNTIAIVISREELPGLDAWILDHPLAMLVGSLVSVGVGLALASRRET